MAHIVSVPNSFVIFEGGEKEATDREAREGDGGGDGSTETCNDCLRG
jgi:hypothetical protein